MSIKCNKNAPIGVFDSGVGGLTVAREIMRQLPKEHIVYFGVNRRTILFVFPDRLSVFSVHNR